LQRGFRDPARRLAAAEQLLVHIGWNTSAISPVRGRFEALDLVQVATAGEPRAVVALAHDDDAGVVRAMGLGYSREVPYLLYWSTSGLKLLDTSRWGV
jgi:hypothetical protein